MFPATARSRMVYACFRDLLSSASRAEPITAVLDISADRIPLFADAFPPHPVAAIAPTVLGRWSVVCSAHRLAVMSRSYESRYFDRDNITIMTFTYAGLSQQRQSTMPKLSSMILPPTSTRDDAADL
jgi:hypothetical protein